ncbi:3-oxoacyl-[acyl-carrier-protein] synthase-3 [Crossiella equi]|uniref:3-oxoacyl-[acyl-carrier-protein] synthase-3 n=1 Tax=Crossiella equi TaxID=130796 RepID=A0ABS5AQR2_9PSEU|nr:ketoacyl-ACP synthase III [Crossiella equi]MBP2478554.1 3-oxoacyl-[acyl-carrier-protein] synthase-3 [Crossiella equi]
MRLPTGVIATGSYLPARSVGNDEVAATTGVTDEWITRKTRIRGRRHAAPHEATSDLAAEAARAALTQAGVTADQVSYIVVATSTPDHPQPATGSIVQHLLGATNAAAFDVNSVCSGFVFALSIATSLLHDRPDGYALVIGADIYSRILDHTDRKTAILFGDGAGAVLLGPVASGQGILGTRLTTRGDLHEMIKVPAGGSRFPSSPGTLAEGQHFFTMDGRGVRGFVEASLGEEVHAVLRENSLSPQDIQHFVPHQANGAMLGDVWPTLGLTDATCHLALEQYGNTGAASIPITLDVVHRRRLLAENDMVLLCGFGGGMSVGSSVLSWAPTRYARPSSVSLPRQGEVPAPVPALAVPGAGV